VNLHTSVRPSSASVATAKPRPRSSSSSPSISSGRPSSSPSARAAFGRGPTVRLSTSNLKRMTGGKGGGGGVYEDDDSDGDSYVSDSVNSLRLRPREKSPPASARGRCGHT
jgi:hypothetical protein